jgi:hypothetical protein
MYVRALAKPVAFALELQVPGGICAQTSPEAVVWGDSSSTGANLS